MPHYFHQLSPVLSSTFACNPRGEAAVPVTAVYPAAGVGGFWAAPCSEGGGGAVSFVAVWNLVTKLLLER
jgi:hypothetical protein